MVSLPSATPLVEKVNSSSGPFLPDMDVGVAEVRVAVPPESAREKSETSGKPEPLFVLKIGFRNLTVNLVLYASTDVAVMMGAPVALKYTSLLSCVVVASLSDASNIPSLTGVTVIFSKPEACPDKFMPKV